MTEMTINSNNKIISRDMLLEIFEAMNSELKQLKKTAEEEKQQNEPLKSEYQKWTLRYFDGYLKFSIYFLDNHNVTYDNYDTFVSIFKNQSASIERIFVHYRMSYNKAKDGTNLGESVHNNIDLTIDKDKLVVGADLSSGDHYFEDTYNMIMQKIATAPPKFDHIIKAKKWISFKIGLPLGLIIGAILIAATIFVSQMHDIYRKMPYILPALQLLLGSVISIFIGSMRTSADYAKLIPKKYGGYDPNTRSSYYNDDLKKLTETSEVLIGDKTNNLTIRNGIAAEEKKAAKRIPIAFGIMLAICLISLAIIFLF